MTCSEGEARLDGSVDGLLPGAEFQEMEVHLAGCPPCREQERRLRAVLAQAAALPKSLSPPRHLWPGIAERIGGRKRGPLGGRLPSGLAPAAPGANPPGPSPPPPPRPAPPP